MILLGSRVVVESSRNPRKRFLVRAPRAPPDPPEPRVDLVRWSVHQKYFILLNLAFLCGWQACLELHMHGYAWLSLAKT
jgi:hypothetical protein